MVAIVQANNNGESADSPSIVATTTAKAAPSSVAAAAPADDDASEEAPSSGAATALNAAHSSEIQEKAPEKSEIPSPPNLKKSVEHSKELATGGAAENPPVKWKHEFLSSLESSPVVIVVGGSGSGRSTQIPQFVFEALDQETPDERGKMRIACTQPHRLAAISVSRRVAREMDVTIGEEIGYGIDLEDCTSSKTVLKFLTDEVLLREAMTDPLFMQFSVVILDEAQERTLATDLLFVLLKEALRKRIDLKLIVVSSAPEAKTLEGYFCGASLLRVPGRLHPVEIYYTEEPKKDYLETAIRTVVEVHESEKPGGMLVFLTGEVEIEDACRKINEVIANSRGKLGPVEVVPLYPTLPPDKLEKVSHPAPPNEGGVPVRRIVVSTDIAETSLSIDGIVYVIDSGLTEQKFYNPRVRVESMQVTPISKASVHQRSWHAGRIQQGKCFRLYTQKSYNDLPLQKQPEILRSNLATTFLILKMVGIDDLVHFDYMDPPPPEALMRAAEALNYLGALDDDGNVTKLGQIMSKFPLDPQMSKMLVISPEFNCSSEILSLCAMLSVPNCFVLPNDDAQEAADEAKARFGHIDGDHLMLMNVYRAYKQNIENPSWCRKNFVNQWALQSADKVRQQLVRIMAKFNLKECNTDFDSPDYYINIRKAILAGYFMQVAHREENGDYLTVKDNQVVKLHPSNCLGHESEWVIFNEYKAFHLTYYIHTVTDIRAEWLVDLAPHYYDMVNFPEGQSKRVLEKIYRKRKKIEVLRPHGK